MYYSEIEEHSKCCSNCGHDLESSSEEICSQCDELEIREGTTCEWCDSPAEYTVNGEPACEYHHDMAYPID